ncbi:DinB family protein [Mucilaginibacter arboris]|uniref:DinB family protein n=1 Tax=Mucilaginibacter arboris TaxID=2682090 RepID=A0A7K1SWH2_9SPHI|nr:DinB family protein [Mucilaginibacter arboris]MVN21679.1 DinB family protein [Mucilaginibacter arboris]
MHLQIQKIKATRTFLLNLVEGLTIEQLNQIPEGFNNNIIWNLAHLTAAQQSICYKRSGLKPVVQDKYFSPYLPGTKPDSFIDQAEAGTIKTLLLSSLDEFESDYKKGFFKTYTPFVTRYGVAIDTIDDAINFLPYHEGYHTGAIMALKRLVKV